MAKTRYGAEIEVGKTYLFAETRGHIVHTVTEILDDKVVRINDHWKDTRWACNIIAEVR